VSGIKTAVARDAELLLFNMVPPTRVGDYFACGIFYMFRLNCKSLSIVSSLTVTCVRKHCQ